LFCQTLIKEPSADDSMIIIHSTGRANFAPRVFATLEAEMDVLLEGRSVLLKRREPPLRRSVAFSMVDWSGEAAGRREERGRKGNVSMVG
jgi:hypothetical protein